MQNNTRVFYKLYLLGYARRWTRNGCEEAVKEFWTRIK
jgi:hypothetical protein